MRTIESILSEAFVKVVGYDPSPTTTPPRPKGQHLTEDERKLMVRLRANGHTVLGIADFLGCHKSTVDRVLREERG